MQQLALNMGTLQQMHSQTLTQQKFGKVGDVRRAFGDLPKPLRKSLLSISDDLKRHFGKLQECSERVEKLEKGWQPDMIKTVLNLQFQMAKEEYVPIDGLKIAEAFDETKK